MRFYDFELLMNGLLFLSHNGKFALWPSKKNGSEKITLMSIYFTMMYRSYLYDQFSFFFFHRVFLTGFVAEKRKLLQIQTQQSKM